MRWLVGLLAVLAAACSGRPAPPGAAFKPSILLVTIDTLRADHVGDRKSVV